MRTLVVTDLDGTLWDITGRCHPKTLRAIDQLERFDIPLIAATGRRRRGVRLGFGPNNLTLPTIALNGAIGFDVTTGRTIFADAFPPAQISAIIGDMVDADLSPIGQLMTEQVAAHAASTIPAVFEAELAMPPIRHPDLPGWLQTPEAALVGVVLLSMNDDELNRALDVLIAHEYKNFSYHDDLYYPGWMMMIQPPRVTKWTGVANYLSATNSSFDQIIAVGDNTNDRAMLANADIAVGIKGGHPEILELVDHLIDPPEVGGWESIVDLVSDQVASKE